MAREESRAIFFMKVKATNSALKLIEEIKAQHGEELLFHQSGGCCDGSAPMCYPRITHGGTAITTSTRLMK